MVLTSFYMSFPLTLKDLRKIPTPSNSRRQPKRYLSGLNHERHRLRYSDYLSNRFGRSWVLSTCIPGSSWYVAYIDGKWGCISDEDRDRNANNKGRWDGYNTMVYRSCSDYSCSAWTISALGKCDARSPFLRNCSRKCESLRRAEEKWHYNPTSCCISCLMYGIRARVRHKLGRLMVLLLLLYFKAL
jgi:hypothetical protein